MGAHTPSRPGPATSTGPGPVFGMLALMWAVFVGEVLAPVDLTRWGLRAHDVHAWYGIATMPFLHAGLAHIVGNSLPFLVLGIFVCWHGHRAFWRVIACGMVCSGLSAWLLSPPGTIVVGASGLEFALFTFLVARPLLPRHGSWRRTLADVVVALAVIAVYGSAMLAGVLAAGPSVSWQGHLGGAVGGLVAAAGTSRRGEDA